MKLLPLICLSAVTSFGFVACSGDDSTPTPSTTDAGDTDSGRNVGDASTQDTGLGLEDANVSDVNGCAAADFAASDHTAASDARAIAFPTDEGAGPYTPKCMSVKVGQSVTWNGSFVNHPLFATGGDSPTPISNKGDGTTVTFTFSNAGTFGYGCTIHSSMRGAIKVSP